MKAARIGTLIPQTSTPLLRKIFDTESMADFWSTTPVTRLGNAESRFKVTLNPKPFQGAMEP